MFTHPPHRLVTAMAFATAITVPSALFAQVEPAKGTPPAHVLTETAAPNPDLALLATFVRMDREEIRTARATLPTLQNAEVKGYAQKMIDDHTAHLAATTAIATRLQAPTAPDSTPVPTPTMTTTGRTTTGSPTGVTTTVATTTGVAPMGTNADAQYLTAMVAGHQEILAQLPTDGSKVVDPELRQLLMDTRTTVQAHLDEALRLKARLGDRRP